MEGTLVRGAGTGGSAEVNDGKVAKSALLRGPQSHLGLNSQFDQTYYKVLMSMSGRRNTFSHRSDSGSQGFLELVCFLPSAKEPL
jgi:hypothetical protein